VSERKLSKLDLAKQKGEVLDQIMAWKRQEVPKQMAELPLSHVKAFTQLAPPPLDFAAALRRQQGVSLIAEVKRASPSRGLIAREWEPELIGETYARAGAAAISVLTESRYFQGQLDYLTGVKERLREIQRAVPVLRKDFIYHEYQVYEARMAGADALLLIVGVLSDGELSHLLNLTRQLQMQALVEVHDEAELERALAVGATVVGINNRNLKTFEVDVQTTARLRPRISSGIVVVGESGIRTPDDVRQMDDLGVDAILVGETFCRLPQSERLAKVKEFVAAGRGP
jgi:indole-3-glycerol phosphate synthase